MIFNDNNFNDEIDPLQKHEAYHIIFIGKQLCKKYRIYVIKYIWFKGWGLCKGSCGFVVFDYYSLYVYRKGIMHVLTKSRQSESYKFRRWNEISTAFYSMYQQWSTRDDFKQAFKILPFIYWTEWRKKKRRQETIKSIVRETIILAR